MCRKILNSIVVTILLLLPSELFGQSINSETGLATIHVESDLLDGTSEKGYIVTGPKSVGPWTEKPIQDIPYSIYSITSDFIENIQAQQPDDIFKRIPNVLSGYNYVNIFSSFSTRGFWAGGGRDIINGIQVDNSGLGLFIENVESMDIMTGLSGFIYGSGNVGGFVNYNLKRPTYEFKNKFKLGYSDGQLLTQLDSGGPIITDKLAYRVNVFHQEGHTAIKNQEKKKTLLYGAIDWRITNNLDLLLFGSYGDYRQDGRQTVFGTGGLQPGMIPAPLDPTVSWTTGDSFHDLETFFYGMNLNYNYEDKIKLRLGYMHKEADRKTLSTASSFIRNSTDYSFVVTAMNWDYRADGYSAYLDFDFDTFNINHKLTLGTNGYIYKRYDGRACNPNSGYCGNTFAFSQQAYRDMIPLYSNVPPLGNFFGSFLDNTIANNINVAQIPYWNIYNGKYLTTKNTVSNLMIGDDITINKQWGLMLGLNQARYTTRSYNVKTGQLTAQTNATALTPTFALTFKPIPEVTTYVSYIEALDGATEVGATYLNAGEILTPTVSKQYELGVKATVGDHQITAAVFQIDRASTVAMGPTGNQYLTKDGLVRHRGLELAYRGRFFDSLNILTGLTLIDAEKIRTANGTLNGYRPITTPKILAKMYLEYDLPFLDGLTLTGGVYHTGSVMANDANTVSLPAVTTADLGLRYEANLFGHEAFFRFDVTNLTNKAYWGFVPSEITIGPPRAFFLTGEFIF
ncbi:MAG: TonB-dependent receptor [Deltaproteobacteria bacterium]|jgi:iron complex outermembrane receptor protein|nr:TonB-dependent receptor [Deltaproteobacteria bacterium]